MVGLSNVFTNVKGRVDSNKDISKTKRDALVKIATENLPYDHLHIWNADINGIIIQLRTNDDHLIDFWIENWFPARFDTTRPHGIIYAVTGVENQKPYAYYNSETKTAIFFNTNYYGQCKSWALGIVADIMEMQHDIHSIHGAVVDVGGTGIVIIAPTGTGKSTHSYGLTLGLKNSRIHSDDWIYVDYIGGEIGKEQRASATISERKFYLRTDIAGKYPKLGEIFKRCKLENVFDEDFTAFGNARVILDPLWIGGPEKFINTTRLRAVVLLRRDEESPPEVELKPDDAIEVLREGAYTVLPGAGPEEDWGKIKYEPFYNPYLLVRNKDREELQIEFFYKLFEIASCHILNTGPESIEQTQARIRRIVKEASKRVGGANVVC
ncbi:MAG: hypothetical protein ACE5J3_00475 [Methanosarcinales archaeon]